uniref:GH18 domain-containing protein n=1 Tax=Oryza glumipatula TaxID=40148 RepID=A0A0E0BMD9_9ORYZ
MKMKALLPVAAMLLLVSGQLAAPVTADGYVGQLAVFWGRHKEEGSLREACDTGRYNIVVITFFNVFGYQRGRYGLDISGHPVAAVAADIKHCQNAQKEWHYRCQKC